MKFNFPDGNGSVAFENNAYPAKDGVVDCPPAMGAALGLTPIQEENKPTPEPTPEPEADPEPVKTDKKGKR